MINLRLGFDFTAVVIFSGEISTSVSKFVCVFSILIKIDVNFVKNVRWIYFYSDCKYRKIATRRFRWFLIVFF